MTGASLKYTWLTYRRDQLWFPAAFLAFFVVALVVMRHPAIRFSLARAYLGFIVPLTGGILAGYAVLDDPALELRFATPVRAELTLLTRGGLILSVQTACALVFQLYLAVLGVDLSPLGGVLGVQLAWFLPALCLASVGTAGSLAAARTSVGAFLAAAVWLTHVMMKGWLEANAKYAYLFMGVLVPGHPDLLVNQCTLFAASAALLVFSWVLLRRQERFLGSGAS
jgi:hypothetical protein